MSYCVLFRIEWIKLFRKSNVLFFFLSAYLIFTPVARGFDAINQGVEARDLFLSIVNSFSVMGMVLMAVFVVNSVGNEINEGSFRKALATGLTKGDFFTGKIVLILLISLFIVFSTLLIYLLFGLLVFSMPLKDVLNVIGGLSVLNQLGGLMLAGLFGLFFIFTFRNRTIGLVFYPFWLITEFFVYLFGFKDYYGGFYEFFPGIAGWQLYNSTSFDIQNVIIVIIYSAIFLTSAWYGLVLREEKPGE